MTKRFPALLVACAATATLVACGGPSSDTADATADAPSKVASRAASAGHLSPLDKYFGDDICAILPPDRFATLFSPQSEVETKASARKYNAQCTWRWDRPDAAERQEEMKQAMLDPNQPVSDKLADAMSRHSTNYSVTVGLQETKKNARNFVPRKLNEEELQAQIADAKERTLARLSEAQRKVAEKYDLTSTTEKMLRQANERQPIDGVGEAAYWTPVGGGSLLVLHGGHQMIITPPMTDDPAERLETAKTIYAAIAQ